jgi:hypothetical protein
MPRYDNVEDAAVRALLEQATTAMREGDPTSAVRTCCDAFLLLIERAPDLLEANLPADEKIHHQQFPRLGANLYGVDGKPEIRFERERFSLSDAITYLDFTTDNALRLQKAAQ